MIKSRLLAFPALPRRILETNFGRSMPLLLRGGFAIDYDCKVMLLAFFGLDHFSWKTMMGFSKRLAKIYRVTVKNY